MRVLVDTNVLLRFLADEHPQQEIAISALIECEKRGDELLVVPQVMYEFWVVATRPLELNGLGLGSSLAAESLTELLDMLSLLRDERLIFHFWRNLVQTYQITGKKAHDARLVAAMLRHGIDQILTFNVRDFERFDAIRVVSPEDLASI